MIADYINQTECRVAEFRRCHTRAWREKADGRRHIERTRAMLLPWRLIVVCWTLFSHCWTQAARLRRTIVGSYPLCPLGCASCSSVNGCVTCEAGLHLVIQRAGARQTGQCVTDCPPGQYPSQHSTCRRCPERGCAACTEDGVCSACDPPHVWHEDRCVSSCPPDLVHVTFTNTCQTSADCVLAPWSEWSPCRRNGQTCGYKYGLQYRSRDALQPATPGGRRCDVTSEARRCRLIYRYCSDTLSNSSDPPRGRPRCPVSRRDRDMWRKKRGKIPKRCRKKRSKTNNKHKRRRKDRDSRKETERRRKDKTRNRNKKMSAEKTTKTNPLESNMADLKRTEHFSRLSDKILLYSPNLRTNKLNWLPDGK